MVSLVENMLDLNKRLSESKTGHEKTFLPRQIETTDRQTDALDRELRGLSEEEIAVVKDAARRARAAGRSFAAGDIFQIVF
jgi:hypothetical protein